MRNSGRVFWMTGLSGAGKSTVCRETAWAVLRMGIRVEILDGDELRSGLCSDLSFNLRDRAENIRRIAHLAAFFERRGFVVLVATISPLQHLRDLARSIVSNYVEVFVDAPIEICEARDPKGLYKKARLGQIEEFTGVSAPFERPGNPDVICRTDIESLDQCVAKLVRLIVKNSERTPSLSYRAL
jgi:adenylylsulfate kinase